MNDKPTNPIQLDGPYLEMLSLRHQGYCCSQILVKLLLQEQGQDNPGLVRSMAALCFGGGQSAGICGILTAAACALSHGLVEGREQDLSDSQLPLLLDELNGWFALEAERSYGGITCGEILTASPDKRACALLLIATLAKVREILASTAGVAKGGGPW
ncbi:DVU_1555 family C-GCAxxG-C-C protein [Geotalea sp. SG265]|uniref:DVU_1555 family C-GCAxxG-C-C protein n=1 Tax=Geotalea sp. SG265 TaxID=2922867 RepID=UPI001FAFDDDF|nr:DV_1555 family C-GCAxxG-C-C protein [Geotalea sp. SG265]